MSYHTADKKTTNRLINEVSPYLLQHAYNPVDWHPWGEEALEKAKREDKPVLLSIGYSACHWCHVMAHESFENKEIADIMNEFFVNIKVDREEMPDLDEIYMGAVQIMGGQTGWPLNVFLTPDLLPFYGGTYFPPKDKGGMPGFSRVLLRIAEFYKSNKEDIQKNSSNLVNKLEDVFQIKSKEGELSQKHIDIAIRDIKRAFDPINGGFGGAPKFPNSMKLSLLLRHWSHIQDPSALHMVILTLEKMAKGGIYDQLGGGFHRYSVDEHWLIPHFEKMLYDNALMAQVYLDSYQATQLPLFRQVAEEILEYVLREMTHPEGGFYSTQDADTEGEEGKYYLWSHEEIANVVGQDEGRILSRYFGITPFGNFEEGKNILHLPIGIDVIAELEKAIVPDVEKIILEGKIKLFDARNKRTLPNRDEKIITAWNGLMLSAFSVAARCLSNPQYLEVAARNAAFLKKYLFKNGRLHHMIKDGNLKHLAFSDDYIFLINALIDLYEASFDHSWIEWAEKLIENLNRSFWDSLSGGYYYTGSEHNQLIWRSKSPFDNVVPSSNSMAALALLRLYNITKEKKYEEQGVKTLKFFAKLMEDGGTLLPQMLIALDYCLFPGPLVVIAGPPKSEKTKDFLEVLLEKYQPNQLVILRDPVNPPDLIMPWVSDKVMLNGKVTAYHCKGNTCSVPVTAPGKLRELIS